MHGRRDTHARVDQSRARPPIFRTARSSRRGLTCARLGSMSQPRDPRDPRDPRRPQSNEPRRLTLEPDALIEQDAPVELPMDALIMEESPDPIMLDESALLADPQPVEQREEAIALMDGFEATGLEERTLRPKREGEARKKPARADFVFSACPSCGTPQPDPAPAFCEACGQRMRAKKKDGAGDAARTKRCGECGYKNIEEASSCTNCGMRI